MNIEESIKILDKFTTEHKLFNIKHSDGLEEAIETLLTAYEKEKRLAEANLKDSEEFQDNMCNHRCILNSKVEELEEELEKEKEKNKILLQCLKDSQERCENEHLFLGNPDM